MKFGRLALAEAEGALLAHAAVLPEGRIAKGFRLGPEELRRLADGGAETVVAARLDAGDVAENEAAAAVAAALPGGAVRCEPAATGRVNLFAEASGVFTVRRVAVDALNAVDPGITLATLAPFAPVAAGQMVATVKIIPLAVPGSAVDAARATGPLLTVAPYRPHRVALVQTRLPGLKDSALAKTRRALDARLGPSGSAVVEERFCDHAAPALTATLESLGPADLAIVFGASAVIDAEDVVPAAIRAAGGAVAHLGMPVDPGNLLLLGTFRGAPVLGAPGCARSPKENGFDWVLNRLLAGLAVTPEDIRAMGVGGLLTEIPSRPQPRRSGVAPW